MSTREQHLDRIRDLSLCLNNEDSLGAEHEARNLLADRPAYWYRGQTSPASWLVEMSRCEEHNFSLLKAAEVFADRHPHADQLAAYDAIIPLNEPAVRELSLCYRLQSTFRDDAELRDRERKAIFNPVFFLRMRQDMRDEWRRLYEGCQQRWADRRDAEFEARKAKAFEDQMVGAVPQWPVSSRREAALAIASANVSLDDVARAAVEGKRMAEVAA